MSKACLGGKGHVKAGPCSSDDGVEGTIFAPVNKEEEGSEGDVSWSSHEEQGDDRDIIDTNRASREPDYSAKQEVAPSKNLNRFPNKLMRLLDSGVYGEIFSWNKKGDAIVIHKPYDLISEVLTTHFAAKEDMKFDSFLRKLYRWGFSKHLVEGVDEEGEHIYIHSHFRKGDYDSCSKVVCINKPSTRRCYPASRQSNLFRANNFRAIGHVIPTGLNTTSSHSQHSVPTLNHHINARNLSHNHRVLQHLEATANRPHSINVSRSLVESALVTQEIARVQHENELLSQLTTHLQQSRASAQQLVSARYPTEITAETIDTSRLARLSRSVEVEVPLFAQNNALLHNIYRQAALELAVDNAVNDAVNNNMVLRTGTAAHRETNDFNAAYSRGRTRGHNPDDGGRDVQSSPNRYQRRRLS